MNHIKKIFKKNFTISLGTLSIFLAILIGGFIITRGTTPYISELAITEHSVLGKSAGSVIPASGESYPPPDPTPTTPDTTSPTPSTPTTPDTTSPPTPPDIFVDPWQWLVDLLAGIWQTTPSTPTPNSPTPTTPNSPGYESYETYPPNPLVIGLTIIGNRTPTGTISFSCNDSTNYSITRTEGATGIFPVSRVYNGAVNVGVTMAGNYVVSCINQGYSDSKTVNYNPRPLIPSDFSLSATPRSIIAGAKVTLLWSITDPNNTCRIIASPICTGACDAAQTNAAATLQSILDAGTTDSNDPYGASRSMTSAIQTPYSVSGTKAQGKKTLQMQYSTEFKLQCGPAVASTTVRVIVTSNNEG